MTATKPDTTLSPETAALIDANLELAHQFLDAAFDDPSLLDDLPPEATLVLIPANDPALARANFAIADREASLGKRVVLRIVGLPKTERPEWKATQVEQFQLNTLRPRWPERPKSVPVELSYYLDTDTLLISFAKGKRYGLPVPWRGPSYLLVDPASQMVLGYLFPRFLGEVLSESPQLHAWLQQARRHDRTPDGLRTLIADLAPVPDAASEPSEEPTVEGVQELVGDLKLVG